MPTPKQTGGLPPDETGTAVFGGLDGIGNPTRRLNLTREWSPDGGLLVWIGLNPSSAGSTNDDPTIRRVRGFSKREPNIGGFVMLNLSTFIATKPSDLYEAIKYGYDDNVRDALDEIDKWLLNPRVEDVVLAWGAGVDCAPQMCARAQLLLDLLRRRCKEREEIGVFCLGLTQRGHPLHPLYLASKTEFREYAL